MKETKTECRVFVSRKKSDRELGQKIREKLQKWAPNLEFFDDEDIQEGANWREELRVELKRADILLLVLTEPAKKDFDWPLYEAGLFESLEKADRRKVVCIYPKPAITESGRKGDSGIPSQLGDKQAVKATRRSLLRLLRRLFHDNKFSNTATPLNPHLTDEDLGPVAGIIADEINGVKFERMAIEYTNMYVQLVVPSDDSLESATVIKSEKESLRKLFGLRMRPLSGQRWTWGDIAERVVHKKDPGGFNRRWTKQLEEAIAGLKRGENARQLTGRFLAADGRLYRPEIEIYRTHENGKMTIDVTFSEQVQDSWLQTARAPVALAASLALASRARHELIEPYLRKVSQWRTEAAREQGCDELSQLVDDIEHDGYFIDQLTKNTLEEAFDEAETEELADLQQEYAKEIRPFLEKVLRDREVTELRRVLRLWKTNNLRFLRIALHRYEAGLPKALEPRIASAA